MQMISAQNRLLHEIIAEFYGKMLKLVLADFRYVTQHEEVKEIKLERRYQTSLSYSSYYVKAQVWLCKILGTPIWRK